VSSAVQPGDIIFGDFYAGVHGKDQGITHAGVVIWSNGVDMLIAQHSWPTYDSLELWQYKAANYDKTCNTYVWVVKPN